MWSRSGSSPLTRGKPGLLLHSRRGCGLIPAHAGKTQIVRAAVQGARAHPRSRGENPDNDPAGMCSDGSSPLTRGKLPDVGGPHTGGRLIPAHAGKTCSTRQNWRTLWAHPRSRGENVGVEAGYEGEPGSSPLTRGKPRRIDGAVHAARLIPAHAGKTIVFCLSGVSFAAHPRSRGENHYPHPEMRSDRGSSPLTRGKRL